MAVGFHERGELFGLQLIDLVEDVQARTILHAKVVENLSDFGVLFGMMRIGNIGDLQDQRRFLHFFQRGAKRSDQIGRQIAQESYCVAKAARGAAKAGARRASSGSSVANIFDEVSTSACVSALKSVDFPAFV